MLCLDTDLGVLGGGSSGALFARLAYSGNNTAGRNIITGVDNDLIWIKDATAASHFIYDSVRGASKSLSSNLTDVEGTQSGVTAFNDDGFTIGTTQNSSGQSYRCFAWKKNAQYLDIVTYTGNGSNRTIAHALNDTPKMIIIKSRSLASSDWAVYHANNTAAPETDYLLLNTSGATADDNTYWNDTLPTSSVFSVGTNNNVNKNGDTYVAYIFGESSGNSKFGKYTGTGSTQSINVGFEPSLVLVKNTAGDIWGLYMGNSSFTGNGKYFEANRTTAEQTSTTKLDITATGFDVKNAGETGASGNTYIYAAWKGV